MRTNAVFSRIALVSRFCAESQLSGKTPEKVANLLFYQKTHGARRGSQDGPGVGQLIGRRGPSPAAPPHEYGAPDSDSSPPFDYITYSDLKRQGVVHFIQKHHRTPPPSRNLFRGPETPFWHFAGTGNWRRSSPSSSPTLLHRPSMFPPSMCE
jgi:hypothetical protein